LWTLCSKSVLKHIAAAANHIQIVVMVSCCPSGDLLAALLLARIHQQPDRLAAAVELAVAGLQGVLAATAAAAGPVATAVGADDK
jgi:pyridoxal/pyridoxine/pyridoxamine kinase